MVITTSQNQVFIPSKNPEPGAGGVVFGFFWGGREKQLKDVCLAGFAIQPQKFPDVQIPQCALHLQSHLASLDMKGKR